MFELNGQLFTVQEIREAAEQYGMDFDSYVATMQEKGMKIPDNFEQEKDEVSYLEGFGNIFKQLEPKFKQYANNALMAASGYVRFMGGEQAANFLLGEDAEQFGLNKKSGYLDPITNEVVSFDMDAYKKDGHDAKENKRYYELTKQYTSAPRYEDVKLPNDQITFRNYNNPVKVVVQDTKTNEITELNEIYSEKQAELQKKNLELTKEIQALPISDSGSFLEAAKKGEVGDALLQGLGFVVDAGSQYVAARLSLGTSMFGIMQGMAYTEYNKEKANLIYGEDDPDAFEKLIKNGEDEVGVPGLLGGFGYWLERAGYVGIQKELAKRALKGKAYISLFSAGNREGWTEYTQGLTERLNRNLGKGMDLVEGVKDVSEYMFTQEAWENYFAGLIGGTGISGGGRIAQRPFIRDKSTNQFINEKVENIRQLHEQKVREPIDRRKKKIDDAIQGQEAELKEYLKNNNNLTNYLSEKQQQGLDNILNEKNNTRKELAEASSLFKKGLLNQTELDALNSQLNEKLDRYDNGIQTIKNDANMSLLMQDLDAAGSLVKDIQNLEQEVYKTEAEFLQALKLEIEAKSNSKQEAEQKFKNATSGVKIDGLKIGNKLLINAEVAAQKNAFATGTHELLHGVLKSTLQANDGTGNLSNKGEGIVKDFVNKLSSREKSLIEQELDKGGYKTNQDGTQKDFKEYGEEYLNFYAQLSKQGKFTLSNIEKAGKSIARIFRTQTDFKQLNFESGAETKAFLDAFVTDSKSGIYRQEFAEMAKEGEQVEDAVIKKSANKLSDKAKEIQKEADDIGKKAKNKAEYDAGVNVEAYNFYVEQGGLDGLIEAKLAKVGITGDNVYGVAKENYIESVKAKMIPEILGFNPDLETTDQGKFGLSGHVNFRLDKRMGDVMDKAKKTITGRSLDASIDDSGRTYAETIADTDQDARLQALEEQNLSVGALETDIVEEGQKSVYRTKLKNAKGQALVQEQQENDIREAVRGIVKSIDTTIDENNFMLTFENAVKKQMKNIVQQAIGSGSDFRTFLTNGNFETIIDFSTIQDLVAMERLVGQKFPEGKRIFSVIVKKNISPTEVDKAIQQGKIKPDVSRDSGPDLYEKRTPTNEELEAFFLGKTSTGKTMQEVLNYTIGRSTLGTRKDGLSRMIVTELAQDAALETLQEPNTLQDAVIISENAAVEVQVATLARKLNRPIDLKFSKTIEDIKKLDDVYQQVNSIQKIYNQKGFDSKLAKEIRNTNELEEAAGIANQNFVNRIYELFWQVKSIPEVKQKLKELRRKHPEMKVHKMFEKIVINNAAKVFDKMDNIKSSLRTPTEKGAAQDLILTATNDVLKAMKVGIEVKGTTARNTSTSFLFDLTNKVLSFPQGKSEASFEENGMQPINDLFNRAKEAGILEDLETILNVFPEGLNETKNGDIEITEQQWEAISNSGIRAKLSRLLGEVTPSWVAETYLRKKNPSQYINMGVSGLFSFDNVLNADVTKFQDLDMKIPLTMRLVRSTNKLRLRVEAQLDSRNFPKQKTNLYAEQGMQDFANSIKFSKSKTSALNNNIVNDAFNAARTTTEDTPKKGISIFDFDETVGVSENFVIATKDGKTIKISSDTWPHMGEQLAADGWTFDFNDFNKVTKGRPGPLMQKLKNQIKKYGVNDVYILTARAAASEKAIHDWLKSQGINLPIENITGLGNSTGEAKAMWILDKYANQGYNDIYFVDDAIPNVEAVKVILDQLDVKGKSVQAKMKFSKTLNSEFNKIIEQNKGVNAEKIFSDVSAKKLGAKPGGLRFFVPPSADDFLGLLRYFAGKGKKGEADMAFFKKALIDPFARGYIEMNSAKMGILNDFKALRKQYPKVKKQLGKLIPGSAFTYDNAIRVYLFNEAGFDIPGISDAEVAELSQVVKDDADLLAFAEGLSAASRAKEGYLKPSESWAAENIAMDMQDAATKINRAKYLEEWQQSADEIFSKDNLNKIQAVYGSDVRSAFEDMLYAMKTGQNRPSGSNKIANQFMNWINNSVGAIMFFNARSAVLQTISTVNFLNFEGNNIFSAAAMFANQKQYWSDFKTLMNSDYLKARRAGLSMNINEAELANAVAGAKNKATAALRYLLNLGFTPTQIADSFAIAAGGSTFYRSKIKKYLKEGMNQVEAEKQAFQDFQEIAEETQQSARPDKLSQQQRSVIGRIILNFANTPMQMARLMKKAAQDLAAGRGDWKSNVSRILYYGAVQNIIFASLQNAIFALTFDEEDDEKILEKSERIFNGALDSLLRGSGIYGAVASTIKNTIIRFLAEREKKSRADYGNVIVEAINLSPSIGSKFRKMYSALKTDKYNRKVYDYMGYDNLENPVYQAITSGVEGTTNVPLNRLLRKIDNMKEVFNDKNTAIQRIFVGLGWDQWSLGIDPYKEVKEAKEKMKGASDKVPQIPRSANPRQCRKRKSDGTRCKVMTRSKSQFCHYHD